MKCNVSLRLCALLCAALCLSSCTSTPSEIDAYDVTQPPEQLLKEVKRDDFIVMEDSDVSVGQALWSDFYETTQAGKPASVKLATYYTLDHDNVSDEYLAEHGDEYPMIYLAELSFDGEVYTYRSLNGQDGVTGFTRTYEYLMRYEDIPKSESATFISCERYVLTHDNTITYDRLQYGLYSSQLGDYIDHLNVYSDYQYKPEYAEREKSS